MIGLRVQDYIKELKSMPAEKQYHVLPDQVLMAIKNAKLASDIANLHREVLRELIGQRLFLNTEAKLPPSIEEMFEVEVTRIESLCEQEGDEYFQLNNDLFLKDLAICSSRVLPAGAQLVEASGLPRRVALNTGFRNFVEFWRFVAFQLKGLRPLYEIHTNLGNLTDFNPEGWDRCYVRVGQLLKLNTAVNGMIGGSWFYDPVVQEISPNLAYLRQRPEEHHARFFFSREEGEHSGALAKSKTRRQLFDDGKYVPRAYFMVWPRESLIEFSERYEKSI